MSDPTRYPPAVRESAARAADIEKQLLAGQPPAEPAPPAAPAASGAQPAPAVAPAPAAPAAPADEELARETQRRKTLEGKYASQQRQIAAQQEEIARLNAALQQVQLPAAADASVTEAVVAKLREGLGAELAETLDSRVRAIVADALRSQMEPMRNVMAASVEREQSRLEQSFYEQLSIVVPEWAEMNNDPGFVEWLNQIDPAAGVSLLALLRDAEAKMDVRRAAVFFNTYKREKSAAARPSPTAQPQTMRPDVPQPHVARTYTVAQIEQHFQDRQRGKFRGREKDADAIEAEFMIAQREGRIVRG